MGGGGAADARAQPRAISGGAVGRRELNPAEGRGMGYLCAPLGPATRGARSQTRARLAVGRDRSTWGSNPGFVVMPVDWANAAWVQVGVGCCEVACKTALAQSNGFVVCARMASSHFSGAANPGSLAPVGAHTHPDLINARRRGHRPVRGPSARLRSARRGARIGFDHAIFVALDGGDLGPPQVYVIILVTLAPTSLKSRAVD